MENENIKIHSDFMKQQLIEYLKQKGLKYNPALDPKKYKEYSDKKFIAWAIKGYNWLETIQKVKNLFNILDDVINEKFQDLYEDQIGFNLNNIECLCDKESFNLLFRTIIVFDINKEQKF